MTGDYLQAYDEIIHYVRSYSGHKFDVEMQRDFVNQYWDLYCVKVVSFLGICFKKHNELAKTKWEKLDYQVRINEKKLREGL